MRPPGLVLWGDVTHPDQSVRAKERLLKQDEACWAGAACREVELLHGSGPAERQPKPNVAIKRMPSKFKQ